MLQVFDRCADVLDSSPARFLLDGKGAFVADIVQGHEKFLKIDATLAKGSQPAPFEHRLLGRHGVLKVGVADVAAEGADGLDEVATAVEDHVGGVKIHREVSSRKIVEELKELEAPSWPVSIARVTPSWLSAAVISAMRSMRRG